MFVIYYLHITLLYCVFILNKEKYRETFEPLYKVVALKYSLTNVAHRYLFYYTNTEMCKSI